MSKETFYFSHDYNARTDPRIKKLLTKMGMSGYGIWWALVEDLYNNANALPTDYESIAYDLRVDKNTLISVIEDFELFVIEDGFFGNKSIQRRLDERAEKSLKARESATKRWDKNANASKVDATAMRPACEPNAIKERKVKESKGKDINVAFDVFWDMYDKKVGEKERINKKWEALSNDDRNNIIEYLPLYKLSQPDKKYRKDPATFLNNKSWNDEIIRRKIHQVTKDLTPSQFI